MLSTAEGLYPVNDIAAAESTWGRPRELVLVRPRSVEAVPSEDRPTSDRSRRIVNLAVAAVSLVVALPLMLLIALVIKLTSRGPVLYKQVRVGADRRRGSGGHWRRRVDYGGKLFMIYKFRTMEVQQGAEQVWAKPNDPRITTVGRVLRKYRLDELPQLINVLKGEMNVVGPRPEQPQIFVTLREKIDGYADRQQVLPGITGLAQVNLNYDTCVEDVEKKLHLDLKYTREASVSRDLEILARTIPVVVFRKGAL